MDGSSTHYRAATRDNRARVTRRLAVALLAALAVFAFQLARAQAGSAATGYPCPQTGAEQIHADYTGGTVTVTGSGFATLCDVAIQIGDANGASPAGTAASDLAGAFTYTELVSATTGTYRIDASGLGGATLASTSFNNTLAGPASTLIV